MQVGSGESAAGWLRQPSAEEVVGRAAMSQSCRVREILGVAALIVGAGVVAFAGGQGRGRGDLPPPIELTAVNAMNNPYRMLENWPHLADIKSGAAIGTVLDGRGGVRVR